MIYINSDIEYAIITLIIIIVFWGGLKRKDNAHADLRKFVRGGSKQMADN